MKKVIIVVLCFAIISSIIGKLMLIMPEESSENIEQENIDENTKPGFADFYINKNTGEVVFTGKPIKPKVAIEKEQSNVVYDFLKDSTFCIQVFIHNVYYVCFEKYPPIGYIAMIIFGLWAYCRIFGEPPSTPNTFFFWRLPF